MKIIHNILQQDSFYKSSRAHEFPDGPSIWNLVYE